MPDFNSREERLTLKLRWIQHKLDELDNKFASLDVYLLSAKYHNTELIEHATELLRHATKSIELREFIIAELNEIYQELKSLKKL